MTGSPSNCPEAASSARHQGKRKKEKRPRYRSFLFPFAFFLLPWSVGCGDAKTVKLQGTVTLDGKPLAGAMVTFLPLNEKAGRAGGGRSDSGGNFRLTTFKTDDGLLPGQYRVTVVMPDDDPANVTGGNPMEMDEKAKRAYFSKASPQARREAAKHKTKKASPIPAVYSDPLKTPLKETVPPGRPVKIELQSTVP
jgi:hypothetical protein